MDSETLRLKKAYDKIAGRDLTTRRLKHLKGLRVNAMLEKRNIERGKGMIEIRLLHTYDLDA